MTTMTLQNAVKKPRTKKAHAAEIASGAAMIEAIRSADHFLASLFVGRGVYQTAPAATVREALLVAPLLESAFPTTRRCIIYAVSKDGAATMLTYDLINKLMLKVDLPKGFEIARRGKMMTLFRGVTRLAASEQFADLIQFARETIKKEACRELES